MVAPPYLEEPMRHKENKPFTLKLKEAIDHKDFWIIKWKIAVNNRKRTESESGFIQPSHRRLVENYCKERINAAESVIKSLELRKGDSRQQIRKSSMLNQRP